MQTINFPDSTPLIELMKMAASCGYRLRYVGGSEFLAEKELIIHSDKKSLAERLENDNG